MESGELALFMISACAASALLEHPSSALSQIITEPAGRRVLIGIAMGLTAIALVYSPWGKRSGAHFNPAVTLAFWRLGRVSSIDAAFYAASQFIGGVIGVFVACLVLGALVTDPAVNYVATLPGPRGAATAFVAETLISFALMMVVLLVSDTQHLARYSGMFCGVLVATFISIEAPLSGMSMNPARSFASAFVGGITSGQWIYLTAPPLGMLAAAETYLRCAGRHTRACAKLHHENRTRCIFCRRRAAANAKLDSAGAQPLLLTSEGRNAHGN